MEVSPAKQINDQPSNDQVNTYWRVTWNITGTILASTGEDGYIRLWKMNYLRSWRCVCVFAPHSQATALPEGITSVNDNQSSNTFKYYKRGTITHPNQVPWH